jgi:hypothetical protein
MPAALHRHEPCPRGFGVLGVEGETERGRSDRRTRQAWENPNMKLLSLLISMLFSAYAFGGDNKVESEVRQRYDGYAQAVRSRDSAKAAAFLCGNFSMKSPDGKIHDHTEMSRYQSINAQTTKKVNSYTAEIESLAQLPDGNVSVVVLQKYDREQAPADAPDQTHRIQTSVVQREVWHKEGDSWKILNVEEILSGPVLMDGKPLTQ